MRRVVRSFLKKGIMGDCEIVSAGKTDIVEFENSNPPGSAILFQGPAQSWGVTLIAENAQGELIGRILIPTPSDDVNDPLVHFPQKQLIGRTGVGRENRSPSFALRFTS